MKNDFDKRIRFGYSFLLKKIVHINLQLLYSCNFRCRICDFWKDSQTNKQQLSVEDIKIIAGKLKPLGPQIISIGGGEPLMHKDIVSIASILGKNNFPVMICNGWFMTKMLAKELFKAGMYEVSISLDYADPEKHDAQRGIKGAFDKAVNALKILNENREFPHQRVHMISVVMDDNIDEIHELIRLAKKIGVTYLVTLYSSNRGKKDDLVTNKNISKHLLKLKKENPEFVALRGYLNKFSEAAANKGTGECKGGINFFNIDSSGNVSFCIDHLEQNSGNMLKDDIDKITANLKLASLNNRCAGCWTSCRGSIETLLYGSDKIKNYYDMHQMTKKIRL